MGKMEQCRYCPPQQPGVVAIGKGASCHPRLLFLTLFNLLTYEYKKKMWATRWLPFTKAITRKCRGSATTFPGSLHFNLATNLIIVSHVYNGRGISFYISCLLV